MKLLPLLLFAAVALAGCGHKGPLELPTSAAPAPQTPAAPCGGATATRS